MTTEDNKTCCSSHLLQQHAVSALEQMLQVINIRKEDFLLEGQYGFVSYIHYGFGLHYFCYALCLVYCI